MTPEVERQIAHLAMVQAIIARMAANSFALKTLTVTLAAGVIALVGSVQQPQSTYLFAAIVPLVIFWGMDAKYLRLERLYRALYDGIRHNAEIEPFDMRVDRYQEQVQSSFAIAFSWSVGWIYGSLIFALAVVARVISASG